MHSVRIPAPPDNAAAKKKDTLPALAVNKHVIWLMATACGLSAATLIYVQPLLASMSRSFAVSINAVGWTATLGQLGYALGLLLIVPLGERFNRRKLIFLLAYAVAGALAGMAIAPTVPVLVLASFLVGLTSVIPELMIPFAAGIVPAKQRGRTIGAMLFGLLAGTPLANLLGGFVGEHLGWRAMYWLAAIMMIVMGVTLLVLLPDDKAPKQRVGYLRLLVELWHLLRSEPLLQEVSLFGILVYGTFTIFWVTFSFLLETPPFHYGSDIVGLFGLVGIAGAFAALFTGRLADRHDARHINGIALVTILIAFIVLWCTHQWLVGLIIGALLLDLGAQSNQVANETRLYTLPQVIWNRLNTIYILMFCFGGSFGSLLGAWSWTLGGANGAYGIACLMLVGALTFYVWHRKRVSKVSRQGPILFK